MATLKSAKTPLELTLQRCRHHFIAAAVFSGLLNLLYLAPTLYMLQVYDRVVPTRGVTTLVMLSVIFVITMLVLSSLDYLRTRILVRASARLDRYLAQDVLKALLSPALDRVGGRSNAALMREYDVLRQTLTGSGILAAFDAPWTPIYIGVCFLIHPALGILSAVGALILLALAYLNEKGTKTALQRANEAANFSYSSLEYSVGSAGVLKALGMQSAMVRRHTGERVASVQTQMDASFTSGFYMALTKFFRLTIQSMALGLAAYLAVEQKISAGAIFAGSLLIGRSLAPIELVLGAWKNIIQARGAAASLHRMFAEQSVDVPHTLLPAPTGQIQVERLFFASPDRDRLFLSDISFSLDAGESVGIVGASGAGKSMLVKLIAGALRPSQGAIRFDGANISDWDPNQLARFIGYQPQENTLFAGTIKENICRFRNFVDDDAEAIDTAVIKAAKLCGAHDMIIRLPHGYDTMLGPGGQGLSLGQGQRIVFARALYGDPKIVILDEPNSHLDGPGDLTLFNTLGLLKEANVTVITVAHRTAILANVDKLMVLRDGRLEMFGPRAAVAEALNSSRPSEEVAGKTNNSIAASVS